ncbi:MAG TPA: signal peptide peptidase SppA, partial [Gammaproteobacteria bacterium]|nr:signal peptide peptidase SppA [Gammaproteobacteria bacterium]
GLIDDFGDLGAAVRSAASLAKLDNYGVTYVEPQLSPGEQFLVKLAGDGSVRAVSRHLFAGGSDLVATLRPVWEPLARALALDDPNGVYAYCFCAAATTLR